jgi:DNA-binding Lrp family transcriptional regulator
MQAKRMLRMARFTNGWVKIHRKMMDGRYDAIDIGLLVWLIANANYVDGKSKVRSNLGRQEVRRGQLITSHLEIAEKLNLSRKTVTKRLKVFQSEGIILQKRDNHGSIITILNYNRYQETEESSGTTPVATVVATPVATVVATVVAPIEESKEFEELNKGKEREASPVDNFLNFYCEEMQKVYGKPPRITSHLRRVAGEILDEIGLERSIALAGQFCASNRDYYIKRAHSLDVMLKDLAIIDMFV